MKEIKPCPFHEESIYPTVFTGIDLGNGNPGSGGWHAVVECPECGTAFEESECSTKENAIEAVTAYWNTRYGERTCYLIEDDTSGA